MAPPPDLDARLQDERETLSLIDRLRGRDGDVDALLRRLKKDELSEAGGEALGKAIDELRVALRRLEV